MRVAIVPGHSSAAPGAVRTVDCGKGRHRELREYDLCREISEELATQLRRDGHSVFEPPSARQPLGYPEYLDERIREINEAGVHAAVELHLNASLDPSLNFALALYHPQSERGKRLAEALAAEFQIALLPYHDSPPRVEPDTWTGGTKAFVRHTHPPAVIGEPCFLSHPPIQEFIRDRGEEFVAELVVAYRRGIEAWWAAQAPMAQSQKIGAEPGGRA